MLRCILHNKARVRAVKCDFQERIQGIKQQLKHNYKEIFSVYLNKVVILVVEGSILLLKDGSL